MFLNFLNFLNLKILKFLIFRYHQLRIDSIVLFKNCRLFSSKFPSIKLDSKKLIKTISKNYSLSLKNLIIGIYFLKKRIKSKPSVLSKYKRLGVKRFSKFLQLLVQIEFRAIKKKFFSIKLGKFNSLKNVLKLKDFYNKRNNPSIIHNLLSNNFAVVEKEEKLNFLKIFNLRGKNSFLMEKKKNKINKNKKLSYKEKFQTMDDLIDFIYPEKDIINCSQKNTYFPKMFENQLDVKQNN